MIDRIKQHFIEVDERIKKIGGSQDFLDLSKTWNQRAIELGYQHNFTWLGRPIIQAPQDLYAIQELIWKVKPDLIIETGVAHGGSLILSASLIALMNYIDDQNITPNAIERRVIGIDIDIRNHNRQAIENHTLGNLITLLEGSSVDEKILQKVSEIVGSHKKIMVFLDSNHTHDHVFKELEAYTGFVSLDSYCVVWDTGIDDLPAGFINDRSWGPGNNPKTAVREFLKLRSNESSDSIKPLFIIDKEIEHKIAITAATDGFLRRVK